MSKKRWAKLACLMIMVAILVASVMTSCTFIQENEDRVANSVIATVTTESGLKVTVTRNEVLDYYSSYAYYLINYNGMTAEEAMDWAVENKIKSKYLTLQAIDYLKSLSARQGMMKGGDKFEKAEDVLTLAEWYAAIYSVNNSMQSTLDNFVSSAEQTALTSKLSQAKRTDVKEIKFTEATLKYLKDEYWVGEEFDTDRVQIIIVYDDETESEAYTVPDSYYSTAFSSDSAGEQTLVVKFDERIEKDGNVTYETLTVEHTYTVMEGRATKNKPDEDTDVDDVTIGDVKVNRYATEDEIHEKLGDEEFNKLKKMDIAATYQSMRNDVNADPNLTDAYRQLNENITNNHRSMDYYYNNAFESAATSALQAAIYKKADEESAVTDAEIIEQFRYLYETGKNTYAGVDPDDYASTFAGGITSNRETLYYYPGFGDEESPIYIDDFFYVYQILFNFSDEQKSFITENTGDDEELQKEYYEIMKGYITTKESNPKYDSTYHCPMHEKREDDAVCKWVEEDPENNKAEDCPSLAYRIVVDEETGESKTKEWKFTDVFELLEAELKAVYDKFDNGEINEAERSEQAFAIFEDYMYRFNDDGGIMNSSSGYLIAPEKMDDPNGFYQQFLDLAYEVKEGGYFVGNAFNKDGKLAYNFTPYGVHLICISSIPFTVDDRTGLILDSDEKIVEYLKQAINLKGDTLYKSLKDSLTTERRSQQYSAFTTKVVPDELMDDASKVIVDKKVQKKLYKDYLG